MIVSRVREVPIVDRITVLGSLRSRESVDVTAKVTETISALRFTDGERVQAGQVLAEMTDAEQRALLDQAHALVVESQQQFERAEQLIRDGSVPRSELDLRRRERDSARAQLAAIESRIEDRLIRAPFSGVVGLRDVSPGSLVNPGTVIARLDDDSAMWLDASVPSRQLGLLSVGMAVEATSVAYPTLTFSGKLIAIDNRVDPVDRSLRVRALLDNPRRLLKSGMRMEVELLREPRQGLVVPEQALLPNGKRQFVLRLEPDGRVARIEVETGLRQTGRIEILSGLSAGDRVVSQGTTRAVPGTQVRVLAEDDGSRPLAELLRDIPSASQSGP